MLIDLRVSQLLCSRLSHDVVGAAGAVATGLELLADLGLGESDAADAFDMTRSTSRQLSSRLAFFRMAYGLGGGKGDAPLNDAREVAADYMADYGVGLDWPAAFEGLRADAVDATAAKLLLCLVLMGREALPRGGTVAMRLAAVDDGVGAAVIASGAGARVRDADRAAAQEGCPAETLTPHTIHPYYSGLLARAVGGGLEIGEAADEVRLAVLIASHT